MFAHYKKKLYLCRYYQICRNMKILFYADTVFGYGGVQRVLAVVTQGLAGCHDVTILSTDRDENLSMYGYCKSDVKFEYISYNSGRGLEFYFCKFCSMLYKKVLPQNRTTSKIYSYSFFLPEYKRSLIRKINSGDYDAVVGVHAYLSLQLASVRKRLKARKVIGWMHNSYEAFFEKNHPYLPDLKTFFKYEMAKLDDIVVLSHSDVDMFKEKLGLKSEVIYNPLTLQPRGRGNKSYKKFLAVGRFSPKHKGFDILISAFAEFAKGNKDWTLEIVGEGEEERMYRRMIADYGLEDRITLCPFTADIQSHYSLASVYVLSSRWEGFGLVLIEAMSHGLPIISTYLPVTCELLQDRGVCKFFENGSIEGLAEKMRYMSSEADIDQMSSNALNFAEKFKLEHVLKLWNNILGE